ncbi:MAG: 1-acyl-sn-glycerol-3-phosphate acyltransferase [Opitutales bacterium]|nr:1-acyl-sn-glycerol-3-phosphate acyltransferase [Opitutales bacterium]
MLSPKESLPVGNYCTELTRPGWFTRSFPTLGFYRRVAPIVFSSSNRSRKGQFDETEFRQASTDIIRAMEACGARLQVEGTEHVAKLEQPCVFIGNHMSTAETFILPAILLPFRRICFVVKQSLVEIPVFKHIMIHQQPIVVGRNNPREDLRTVLDGGCEQLAAGRSVIVFPQTTRTAHFDPSQFNSIGVKLARKANVPVVPLALQTNAWSNGKWIKDIGPFRPEIPVHFAFGAPLEVEGTGKATHQKVVAFIQEKLKSWS